MAKEKIKPAESNMIFDYKVSDKKSSNKAVLVTLEGYATLSGDKSNRNKHFYTGRSSKGVQDSFWDKVLGNSKMVKEMLDTKTFFGCSRHPNMKAGDNIVPEFGDKKTPISHAIREYSIDDKGVYVVMDVLDNEAGREIKTYVDYGSKIGISTRALGEVEMDKEGFKTPKLDSYQFITWDLVTFPAFSATRMAAVADAYGIEDMDTVIGASRSEFIDGIKKLPECEAKSICDYAGIPYKEAGIEDENKSTEELEEALDQAMQKIKELESKNSVSDSADLIKEAKSKLKRKVRDLNDSLTIANKELSDSVHTISVLEDKNIVLEAKIRRLEDSVEILKKKYLSVKRSNELSYAEKSDIESVLDDKINEIQVLRDENNKLVKNVEAVNDEKDKQLRLINILQDKLDSIQDASEDNIASTDGIQTHKDETLAHVDVIDDSEIHKNHSAFENPKEDNFDARSLKSTLTN